MRWILIDFNPLLINLNPVDLNGFKCIANEYKSIGF